jgi:hypothetical protein
MKYLFIAAGICFSSSLLSMDKDMQKWEKERCMALARVEGLKACKDKKDNPMRRPKHICSRCNKIINLNKVIQNAQENYNWWLANKPQ